MAHPTVSVTTVEPLGGHRVRIGFDDAVTEDRDLFASAWGPVFDLWNAALLVAHPA